MKKVRGGRLPFQPKGRPHGSLGVSDGREIVLIRHTQPEKELQLLLDQLKLQLPEQAPPKIEASKRA